MKSLPCVALKVKKGCTGPALSICHEESPARRALRNQASPRLIFWDGEDDAYDLLPDDPHEDERDGDEDRFGQMKPHETLKSTVYRVSDLVQRSPAPVASLFRHPRMSMKKSNL
ncbi:MAG: hypothetical protein ACLQBD_08095 [Syntrophobacteraceae bacterium]